MPDLRPVRDLLERLVAFDTTSARSNRPVASFVADALDRPTASVEWDEDDDGAKVNLVARIGPEPDAARAGLVLCGHLDCVPATEPEWTGDPFTLRSDGDRWLARGACDMKGFVAIAMDVFRSVDPRRLARPLALLLTADEEVGSLGAAGFARRSGDRLPLPRATVIGEPTSLRAVRMHKGHLKMRITIAGRAAHSGSPHLGRNAIEPAGPVIAALARVRAALEDERSETSTFFPEVPFAVLNVARIAGGDAINVVPDRCAIDVGVRLLPGSDAAPAITRIERAVRDAIPAERADDVTVEVTGDNPPMLLAEDAPVHRALTDLLGQTGSHGVSFASDAGILSRDLGHDCVLYGPGTIEAAHRPDEFVPVGEMAAARDVIAALVARICGDGTED